MFATPIRALAWCRLRPCAFDSPRLALNQAKMRPASRRRAMGAGVCSSHQQGGGGLSTRMPLPRTVRPRKRPLNDLPTKVTRARPDDSCNVATSSQKAVATGPSTASAGNAPLTSTLPPVPVGARQLRSCTSLPASKPPGAPVALAASFTRCVSGTPATGQASFQPGFFSARSRPPTFGQVPIRGHGPAASHLVKHHCTMPQDGKPPGKSHHTYPFLNTCRSYLALPPAASGPANVRPATVPTVARPALVNPNYTVSERLKQLLLSPGEINSNNF